MNEDQVKQIAEAVFAQKLSASQFSTTPVPFHKHTGVDSPKIDYNNLLNLPTTSSIPSGVITAYGGTSAPSGWILCDGSAVSRTTYADLFTSIGTAFGVGDGSTTFNIPDGRANVMAGYKSADTNFGTLGASLGEATHTLITGEIPSHSHTEFTNGSNNSGGGPSGLGNNSGPINSGLSTGTTGGGSAHNNIQQSLTINWIIKT